MFYTVYIYKNSRCAIVPVQGNGVESSSPTLKMYRGNYIRLFIPDIRRICILVKCSHAEIWEDEDTESTCTALDYESAVYAVNALADIDTSVLFKT